MIESVRHAIRDVLDDKPTKDIATRMDVPVSTVYSWGEFGDSGRDPSLAKLIQFVRVSEDARPMSALCREAGGFFTPGLPECGGKVDAAMMRVVKEFGESVAAVAKGLEDGSFDQPDLRRIRREIGETVRALLALERSVEREAQRAERRS